MNIYYISHLPINILKATTFGDIRQNVLRGGIPASNQNPWIYPEQFLGFSNSSAPRIPGTFSGSVPGSGHILTLRFVFRLNSILDVPWFFFPKNRCLNSTSECTASIV